MKTKSETMLELPVRKVGNSLIVTIPYDITRMYGLKEGSTLELIPESKDNFVIRIHKR